MGKIISRGLVPRDDPMFGGGGQSFVQNVKDIWVTLRGEQKAREKADPDEQPEIYWSIIEECCYMAEWEWGYDDGDFEGVTDPLVLESIRLAETLMEPSVEFFSIRLPPGPTAKPATVSEPTETKTSDNEEG
jgi:hypothetical protein